MTRFAPAACISRSRIVLPAVVCSLCVTTTSSKQQSAAQYSVCEHAACGRTPSNVNDRDLTANLHMLCMTAWAQRQDFHHVRIRMDAADVALYGDNDLVLLCKDNPESETCRCVPCICACSPTACCISPHLLEIAQHHVMTRTWAGRALSMQCGCNSVQCVAFLTLHTLASPCREQLHALCFCEGRDGEAYIKAKLYLTDNSQAGNSEGVTR